MSKYGWDVEDLKDKASQVLELFMNSADKEEKEDLFELYSEYVRLANVALFQRGELEREKISGIEKLREIRYSDAANDYDYLSKDIRKTILRCFKDFEPLPKTNFDQKINKELSIYLLADILREIFGEENYQVYLERIIDSPNMLQFVKGDGDSSTSAIFRNGDVDLYTSVVDSNNMAFLSDLAHEAGHGYRFVTNEFIVYPNNKLKEFESFSYQIRVLDFMIKNNIYRKEAIKAMIKLFNRIENLIIILKNGDLQYAKHLQHLAFMAHDRDIFSRTNIPNNRELLRYLEFVKCEYVLPYIYSALAVFDTLESDTTLEGYRSVVKSIGVIDEDEIASSIVEKPMDFNNLANYRNYRQKTLELYNQNIR